MIFLLPDKTPSSLNTQKEVEKYMEHKRFHLGENKYYWLAFILTLLTMAPTDKDRIVWYCLAAILCSTVLFSLIKLGPHYLSAFIKENRKLSVPIFLFSLAHSVLLSRSFYLMFLPSNRFAALASRFHLSSTQLLLLIVLFVFPCMVCSLFVSLSYLLRQYRRSHRFITDVGLILFFSLMSFQISQGLSCGLLSSAGLKHVFTGALIIAALICLINLLTARVKVSVPTGTLPFLLFSTINFYVYCFRGREICPYDLLSVGTAMNVASDYPFFFSPYILLGWLAWIFLMTVLFFVKREAEPGRNSTRLTSGAILLL